MSGPAVPRFPNTAHGPVGILDAESIDGRIVEAAGFVVAALPIPLLAIAPADAEGDDHRGARIVGRIDRVQVGEASGQVLIEAITELPPGEYECGMDLSNVTMRLTWADDPGAVITEDELRNDTHRELLQVCEAGRLIAVTVYEGDRPRAAFPGARITVEAGR